MVKVNATKSPHPADPPEVLIVTCPCGRRMGTCEPGPMVCICGAQLKVVPWKGWKPPPKPEPALEMPPLPGE